MVINVYKLQRLIGNERMAGAVTQGKWALQNSASTLPWKQVFSPPAQAATGNSLFRQGCGHVETECSQI